MLRAKEAKEIGITRETPASDIVKMVVANPVILQRPIVEVDEKAVIARPIEKALELIKPHS